MTANGNVEVAKILMEYGAMVNAVDEQKETPLHWACAEGRSSMIQLLIQRGADVHITDEDGNTPNYSTLTESVASEDVSPSPPVLQRSTDIVEEQSPSTEKED